MEEMQNWEGCYKNVARSSVLTAHFVLELINFTPNLLDFGVDMIPALTSTHIMFLSNLIFKLWQLINPQYSRIHVI